MDDLEKRRVINQYIKEICHYSQMQVFATSVYQKKYLDYQIEEAADELTDLFLVSDKKNVMVQQEQPQGVSSPTRLPVTILPENPQAPSPEERIITKEELALNDGSGSNRAYVAVNGDVYDVTEVARWGGGTHFGLYAGNDLTAAFLGCHNGMYDILQTLPKIGILKQD